MCLLLTIIVSDEKMVFLRERSNNLYGVSPYMLSKTTVEFPSTLLLILIYHILTFYSARLNDTLPSKYYQCRK